VKLRLSTFAPVCLLAAGISAIYFTDQSDSARRERPWQIQKRILASESHLALPIDNESATVDGAMQSDLPKTRREGLKALQSKCGFADGKTGPASRGAGRNGYSERFHQSSQTSNFSAEYDQSPAQVDLVTESAQTTTSNTVGRTATVDALPRIVQFRPYAAVLNCP
jgi:hypothetical protein